MVDYYIAIRPEADYDGLLQRYTSVTGRSPMIPDFGTGYWQCKLRYATQEELLNVTMGFAEVRPFGNDKTVSADLFAAKNTCFDVHHQLSQLVSRG